MTTQVSFEFFPPKTAEGLEKLLQVQKELLIKKPLFFSCTYGAGGSTRETTISTVDRLREQHADTAPHITCIGQTRDTLTELIRLYQGKGINRLVVLRGDLPVGMREVPGDLKYADDLVRLIREVSGDHFRLAVAAYPEKHPQARSFADDIAHFKRKIDAGANEGITQYFYNAEAFEMYLEALQKIGCNAPVYPGIMPILNFANLQRFSAGCGAEIPRWLTSKLEDLKDDEAGLKAYGEEVVTRFCEKLLKLGAPGLHFYTMNQSGAGLRILDNLGL